MLDPKKVKEALELAALFKPGTEEFGRMSVKTAQFTLDVHDVLKAKLTAGEKERLIDQLHDSHINYMRNLLNPIVPDTSPFPPFPHIPDSLIEQIISEWILLVGAVGMVCSAWDQVSPIGWVATKKAEPGVILDAIKRAKQVYSAIIPFKQS